MTWEIFYFSMATLFAVGIQYEERFMSFVLHSIVFIFYSFFALAIRRERLRKKINETIRRLDGERTN